MFLAERGRAVVWRRAGAGFSGARPGGSGGLVGGSGEVPGDEGEEGCGGVECQPHVAHPGEAVGALEGSEHAFDPAPDPADEDVSAYLDRPERAAAGGAALDPVLDPART